MNTNQKLFLFFLVICIIGIGSIFILPKEEYVANTDMSLRIGAGDDITGLLLQQIMRTSNNMGRENLTKGEAQKRIFEDFTFKDC